MQFDHLMHWVPDLDAAVRDVAEVRLPDHFRPRPSRSDHGSRPHRTWRPQGTGGRAALPGVLRLKHHWLILLVPGLGWPDLGEIAGE
jgi:hypothetical protein